MMIDVMEKIYNVAKHHSRQGLSVRNIGIERVDEIAIELNDEMKSIVRDRDSCIRVMNMLYYNYRTSKQNLDNVTDLIRNDVSKNTIATALSINRDFTYSCILKDKECKLKEEYEPLHITITTLNKYKNKLNSILVEYCTPFRDVYNKKVDEYEESAGNINKPHSNMDGVFDRLKSKYPELRIEMLNECYYSHIKHMLERIKDNRTWFIDELKIKVVDKFIRMMCCKICPELAVELIKCRFGYETFMTKDEQRDMIDRLSSATKINVMDIKIALSDNKWNYDLTLEYLKSKTHITTYINDQGSGNVVSGCIYTRSW